jgi:DNA-binding transcriptional regulator WhiA
MKKIFLMVAIIATSVVQFGFAQTNHVNHQTQAVALLPLYYDVKDALVSGDAKLAASKAQEFVKAVNSTDAKVINETNKKDLLEYAVKLAKSKDLNSEREYFASLSTSMITLAKSSKLSDEPVYQMYCPMKKSNWLSSEKAVKNPYYGSAMLTCGNIVETIK